MEMWQADTFDPKTIDAELALARQSGFNCARVFVQYLAWETDPKGMKSRLEQFLAIADKHGIRTLFVLFDDCNFSLSADPFVGKQPEPRGISNGQWVPSPGPKRAHDRAAWPKLEQYVKAVVGAFANDRRVLAWETWNEPMEDRAPLDLVEASFQWARQAKPVQPVAATVYGGPKMQELVVRLSDFVSFHNYDPAPSLEAEIKGWLAKGRPVLCTEWMFRPYDSVPATCLPIFAKYRVAAMNWGFVNGKTQTHLHMRPTGKPASLWQHDLFRPDRTPYDPQELALFRQAIATAAKPAAVPGQWTIGQAWQWQAAQPWLVGFNYIPATAINTTEMWQKETFDPKTIDAELALAQDVGFNSARVFLPYLVWESDPEGFEQRLAQFLKIAGKHKIRTLIVLFDDCAFSTMTEPFLGKQPDVLPGEYANGWTPSPGPRRVQDPAARPGLERYVKSVVGRFRSDERVLGWDLYNEPSNTGMGNKSLPLLKDVFAWARQAKPTQPLTAGVWGGTAETAQVCLELSDVISFHSYGRAAVLEARIQELQGQARPILCTEWLNRPIGSLVETCLPVLAKHQVGAFQWGLVNGKTQTHFPWGSKAGAPEPKLWQYDIFRSDRTPYSPREIDLIKVATGKLAPAAPAARQILMATAEKAPVAWRHTQEKPAEGWFKPDFNDAAWKPGAAPFGTAEPGIDRNPNTVWARPDLWIRREFEMPAGKFNDLVLLSHHDEEIQVYVNGVLVLEAAGYNASYDEYALAPEAAAAFKPGKNLIAVHCHQTAGGQYLDLGLAALVPKPVPATPRPTSVAQADYRGWKTQCLGNGLVELQVLPEIGGRVVQFTLGGQEFMWVNPQLAGKLPQASGLAADGSWFNAGGDKLWPAPQGWDNDQQWPGPPDAVLDGQPYALEKLPAKKGETGLRLTSRPDPRSGIRFVRTVRLYDNSTRVHFEVTMKNIDTKPRRWGIWAHTQLAAAKADGSAHNPLMRAWCPLNPQSQFPKGYDVIFGEKDNPSFQADAKRGLMQVNYRYQVGKIGVDSPAGWVATVNGETGAAFVQKFTFEPKRAYPDGSSVEFWHNGLGQIHAYNKDLVQPATPAENPFVFESEVLSPFAELKPGKSYTWSYDWVACNLGGDFPVVDCNSLAAISEPLTVIRDGNKLHLRGRFGVFQPGTLEIVLLDPQGKRLGSAGQAMAVDPRQPVVIATSLPGNGKAATVALILQDAAGKILGEVARTSMPK
jgi:hypothetical protein